MQVQDLKRWHWLVVSIVIGLALSYVWSNVEWGEQLPTIGWPDFERGLLTKYPAQGHLQNITVLPPLEGKNKVVCEQLRRTNDPRKMRYRPVAFMADAPFKSEQTGQTFPNVTDYLKNVKTQNADLTFKYAWYRETWAVYALWTGMSLFLIGGVWPSIVSLMTGGGLGLQRAAKEPEYDLERFGKGEKREETKPLHAGVTSQDMDEVRRLDEELERRLASGATAGGDNQPVTAGVSQGEIRQLDSGPLQLAEMQKTDEEKQYGGEFYPVVKPHHHKTTESHDPHTAGGH
ncbi:MAG TPA: hypothetical protein VF669_16880 [Tepidisphaeraceae bacterium]|jgi:hypothetical protein